MLKIQKLSLAALMVSAVISGNVFADDKAPAVSDADASYAVGALMGSQLQGIVEDQKDVISYDKEKMLQGVNDALNGKVDITKDKKIEDALRSLDEKLKVASEAKRAEVMKKMQELAKKSEEDGAKFRAEFAKKSGVKETKSGLLYHIEKEGTGEKIKPSDTVKVHYTGKLPDGKVFDSSVERGQPAEFRLDQVIPGWTEGLQLVKKGGKIELVIPPALAYGEQGAGASIPPNSTLQFDVEVLDVIPAKK